MKSSLAAAKPWPAADPGNRRRNILNSLENPDRQKQFAFRTQPFCGDYERFVKCSIHGVGSATVSPTWASSLILGTTAEGFARPRAWERRRARRYPLRIGLHFRGSDDAGQFGGRGETCNISSRAVLFTADAPPCAGTTLELAILWPVRLGDALPLRLIATGPILRSDSRGTVMLIKNFHFARAVELENAA